MISRIISFAIPFLVFFILLFIYTKLAGPIPFSVNSVNTTKSDTFNVSGEGKSLAVPNMAVVEVGISAQGNNVKQVKDQIDTTMNKITSSLKEVGIDAIDIQTNNYSISPILDFREGKQSITGYSANTTISIKVKDIDKVSTVTDLATKNGANQISGVRFDVTDRSKAEDEARQKAVVEAKKNAEQAAKVAGFTLGRLINYQENFSASNPPIMYDRVLNVESKAISPTQVEPGSNDVVVTVTLSYEIN